MISVPASRISKAGLQRSTEAFVSMDGVGAASPSTTVSGMLSMHFTSPSRISSASAAGVNLVSSGLAPAPLIPGILDVSVVAVVQIKIGFSNSCSLLLISSDP